jgi:hypothetical protein
MVLWSIPVVAVPRIPGFGSPNQVYSYNTAGIKKAKLLGSNNRSLKSKRPLGTYPHYFQHISTQP